MPIELTNQNIQNKGKCKKKKIIVNNICCAVVTMNHGSPSTIQYIPRKGIPIPGGLNRSFVRQETWFCWFGSGKWYNIIFAKFLFITSEFIGGMPKL